MNIPKAKEKQLRRDIKRCVGRSLDLSEYRVFLFGSRARGAGTPRSDIDIGIEGPSPIPLERMARIRSALQDLKTLYSIDVVDFRRVDKTFRDVAKQSIEILTP